MSLTITDCRATPSSITVFFSDAVDQTPNGSTSAVNPTLYTIYPVGPQLSTANASITYDALHRAALITLTGPPAPLKKGDWILITVTGVALASNVGHSATGTKGLTTGVQINGGDRVSEEARSATKAAEDAVSYPLLTQQVSFPSAGGGPTTGITAGGRGASLDSTAAMAVTNVLGWKVNNADPKGFIGAITQAFTLNEVEGHTEAAWNPRTYAVQTDLGGGMTGAQASLYMRAKDAVQQSQQSLDGLYPLDPDADPEYVKALREMAKSQMNEILTQFGSVGGPSILRVNTYFDILLGQSHGHTEFDPDKVRGTLGLLRETFGIYFRNNPFSNSIEDEQDITNFRVISDYMTSLLQSWTSNREFFELGAHKPAFFGTQLVLLSRQLSVIGDTVNEVRFAMDSVFIGPAERQSVLLEFGDPHIPPMFIEDILQEIQDFASNEAPRLLQDGGKISVTNNILPVMENFKRLVDLAHSPTNRVPDGYYTVRVKRSLDDLRDQLVALMALAGQVKQRIPPPVQHPEVRLKVEACHVSPASPTAGSQARVTIFGFDFWPGIQVRFIPEGAAPPLHVHERITILNENLMIAEITVPSAVAVDMYDVEVVNPDGSHDKLTNGLTVNVS